MKKKCAFLLCTCDAYSDTWDMFFDLVNIYWKNIPYNIYMNTETVAYKPIHQYPFKINVINTSNKISWSKRLITVLNRIEEDYVLMVLDDFFVKSPVNNDLIDSLVERLELDKTIASFQLTAARNSQEKNVEIGNELDLSEIPNSGWKTHFIPTIWRKSQLLKWLRPHESIWGFEGYGSQRARIWNYKEKVFAVNAPMIYDYLWVDGCSVIVNGKWYDSPVVDEFIKQNNLQVDLTKRGRITLADYEDHKWGWILSRYNFVQIVVKVFNRFRSLF